MKKETVNTDTRPAGSVRLLLVDDRKASRRSFATLLRREGFDIVGQAGTGEDAVRLAQSSHPDIVLMDVDMPDMDEVHTTGRLVRMSPMCHVVWSCRFGSGNIVRRMVQAGASALVSKTNVSSLIAVLHGTGRPPLVKRPGRGNRRRHRDGKGQMLSDATSARQTARASASRPSSPYSSPGALP